MKNKILGVLVVAGIAVLTTLNVSLTGTGNSANNLTLDIAHQKASAEDELDEITVNGYSEDDGWIDLFDFLGADPYYDDYSQYENPQDAEWNPWYQWVDEGLTKDEHAFIRPCPATESNSGGACIEATPAGACIKWESSQTNPNRDEIECGEGAANCSVVDC